MAHMPVVVVDENDEVIGAEMLPMVWKHGLYHRIVRIMAEDESGRILLQKRSPNMNTLPGLWDHSAAGHVDEGDDYLDAALRELSEELGVSGVELEEIDSYRTNINYIGRILNRFNKLYRVRIPADTKFTLQPEEVAEVKWFTPAEVRKLLADSPDLCTDGLTYAMSKHYGA